MTECVANLVLQDAIERIFVGDIYGDLYAGIYVIRGENVVLLGEIVFSMPTDLLICRIWIKKMRNYHNDESQAKRRKKLLPEKLSIENEKNGLKIESFMAWYFVSPFMILKNRGFLLVIGRSRR